MWKSLHPGLKFGITFVIFLIILIVGYKAIENRVFREITNQSTAQIHIGRRSGTLFTGYTLKNFNVSQRTGGPSTPVQTFSTDRLVIGWKFFPFEVTEVSWNPGAYSAEDGDETRTIEIGGGNYKSDGNGWLVADAPVQIGEDSWNGEMDLKIRVDGKEVEGTISIEKLPKEFVNMMGEVPDGFSVPRYATIELNLSGSLQAIRVTGSVSDPTTRRTFRF